MSFTSRHYRRFLLTALPSIARRTRPYLRWAFVVIPALIALFEYRAHRIDTVNARTMEYIKRYEEGSAGQARNVIKANLVRIKKDALRDEEPGGDGNQPALGNDMRTRIAFDLNRDEATDFVNGVDAIVDFYTGLRTCIDAEVCSGALANAYFGGSESRNLHDNLKVYIGQRRATNALYACDMAWFALGKDVEGCERRRAIGAKTT